MAGFPTLRRLLAAVDRIQFVLFRLPTALEDIKINQGLMLARQSALSESRDLQSHEFKVFSEWGEDGIIQHLIEVVEIRNRTFIEFGVEDFHESNCRFLMMKDHWQGFVIDGSERLIGKLRAQSHYWRHDLQSKAAFITRENINALLAESGFGSDIGILSIDLDGNDFHILDAIVACEPRILICEFNAVFGPDRKISVPYAASFNRTQAHFSNLYFGASLAAMTHLANKRGYSLVGTNSVSTNAFFVRNDLMNDRLSPLTAAQAYRPSQTRESRSQNGELTHLRGDARLAAIRGMPVLNVETQEIEAL